MTTRRGQATAGRTPHRQLVRVRGNGFWLVLPILVGNALLSGALPDVYSVDEGVPTWLLGLEWAMRVVVFAAPLLMTVSLAGRTARLGLVLYVVGVVGYVAAWGLAIAGGEALVTDHPGVGIAPYWAPGLFFSGLGLMAGARWYLVPVLVFTLAHTAHGLIVIGS